MGIIIKQSIKGSIWSYLGVGIGFITTAYLYPNYLDTETIGLLGLLLSWSLLIAQFASLGFHGITARLFPYFRNKKKGHNGFIFILFIVTFLGFLLFLILFWIFRPYLAESNIEKSKMFVDYLYLLIPLTFFTLLFNQLDTYNRLLYDTVFGTFMNEFFQRILIFGVMILYIFNIIGLHQLILAYVIAVSAKGIVLFFYLLGHGELNFKPSLSFISPKLRNEMISVGAYSILTGLGGSILFNIDKILVNQMLGLSSTGIYTIAFFFGTMVMIPSRPLLRITGTLIAEAFKRNDLNYIEDIYRRSCLNQFIIGAFLLGGIWINIDNIIVILGPEYSDAKWVILLIGLGNLIDMATGVNNLIIGYSKYYYMSLWFLLILIFIVILAMFLLIPIAGIIGAGASIASSIFVNNVIRYFYIYHKFKMQPFTWKFFKVIFSFIVAFLFSRLLNINDLFLDLLIRSAVFTMIYLSLIVFMNISSDLNQVIHKFLKNFKWN